MGEWHHPLFIQYSESTPKTVSRAWLNCTHLLPIRSPTGAHQLITCFEYDTHAIHIIDRSVYGRLAGDKCSSMHSRDSFQCRFRILNHNWVGFSHLWSQNHTIECSYQIPGTFGRAIHLRLRHPSGAECLSEVTYEVWYSCKIPVGPGWAHTPSLLGHNHGVKIVFTAHTSCYLH